MDTLRPLFDIAHIRKRIAKQGAWRELFLVCREWNTQLHPYQRSWEKTFLRISSYRRLMFWKYKHNDQTHRYPIIVDGFLVSQPAVILFETPDKYTMTVHRIGEKSADVMPLITIFHNRITSLYMQRDVLHRTDGPAISGPDLQIYIRHGYFHRIGGPAIVIPGNEAWYHFGSRITNETPLQFTEILGVSGTMATIGIIIMMNIVGISTILDGVALGLLIVNLCKWYDNTAHPCTNIVALIVLNIYVLVEVFTFDAYLTASTYLAALGIDPTDPCPPASAICSVLS